MLQAAHRCSSDLVLLWLWCRPAAWIQYLAWELPYLQPKKKKKRKKEKRKKEKKKRKGIAIEDLIKKVTSE